jgi:hypothetical protein
MNLFFVFLFFGLLATVSIWGIRRGYSWAPWLAGIAAMLMVVKTFRVPKAWAKVLNGAASVGFIYVAAKEYENSPARALEMRQETMLALPERETEPFTYDHDAYMEKVAQWRREQGLQ